MVDAMTVNDSLSSFILYKNLVWFCFNMTLSEKPFPLEAFLASVVEGLKIKGDARAIISVVEGECHFAYWNQNFGVDEWNLFISIPTHIFYAMTEDELKETEISIFEIALPFFVGTENDILNSVRLTPKISTILDSSWREEAIRFVRGEGVTNQGRVRSDNIASQQHLGLLFRSKAEITLFEALTRAGLAVAPLPVFVRIGNNYNRIEPDFVVVYSGLTFIIEVDGDTFHRELPAEADRRLIPLTWEGVEVRRIRAADLTDRNAADRVVQALVSFMKRRKHSR